MTVIRCMKSMGCTCDSHKVHEIHGLHMTVIRCMESMGCTSLVSQPIFFLGGGVKGRGGGKNMVWANLLAFLRPLPKCCQSQSDCNSHMCEGSNYSTRNLEMTAFSV